MRYRWSSCCGRIKIARTLSDSLSLCSDCATRSRFILYICFFYFTFYNALCDYSHTQTQEDISCSTNLELPATRAHSRQKFARAAHQRLFSESKHNMTLVLHNITNRLIEQSQKNDSKFSCGRFTFFSNRGRIFCRAET